MQSLKDQQYYLLNKIERALTKQHKVENKIKMLMGLLDIISQIIEQTDEDTDDDLFYIDSISDDDIELMTIDD